MTIKVSSYLKMRVLGAIQNAEGRSRIQRIKKVAKLVFTDEDGKKRKFTWRTISTWYSRYQKNGITVFESKTRKDKGRSRKTTPEELLEAINEACLYLKKGKKAPRSIIYRTCIEKGLLRKEQIGQTNFYRYVRKHDLLDDKEQKSPRRLAFAMPHANDLWQTDTMFGPYVKHNGKPVQSKLIAFIDDASRVLCHGQFFPSETADNLMDSLKNALYKRGIPRQIYTDNGSIYCSAEMVQTCARLGITLRHAPVGDGAAKGKVERIFKSIRCQFLEYKLDLSSFERLNQQFHDWVENKYNCNTHSILKMTPIDRFALDRKMITYLSPSEANDELFYIEKDRKVAKDNTFRFNARRYETPVELANKTIQIRFPRTTKDRVIVYYKEQRMGEAQLVDLISNALIKRGKRTK